MLTDLLESGGVVVVAILAASVAAWTLGLASWLRLGGERRALGVLEARLRDLLAGPGRDLAAAAALCRAEGRAAGRVLALPVHGWGGGARRDRGVQAFVDVEVTSLRAPLRIVAALAAACPLLGLLGTVLGMIETFEVIARVGPADPGLLARGIQRALVTTQAGLLAALPIVLLAGVLASRTGRLSERLTKAVQRTQGLLCAKAGAGGAA